MVAGLDRFNQRWGSIPGRVRRAVIKEMENQASEIVEEMWSRAPYGETGRLASSIGWTWGDAPKGTISIGKVGGKDYGTLRITIYAGGGDAFYAWFQEFGTVNMTANPFFFPVWRARRKKVKASMARALRKGIKEA